MSAPRTFVRDDSALEPIDVIHGYYQGCCTKCGKKSRRWSRWKHVRMWYEKHNCIGD